MTDRFKLLVLFFRIDWQDDQSQRGLRAQWRMAVMKTIPSPRLPLGLELGAGMDEAGMEGPG